MDNITVGVLTVSDRCDRNEALDKSGPNLVSMIENGVIKNGEVVKTALVPDKKSAIEAVLKNWCDDRINVILTTGGTGISETDVTPEATLALSGKPVPGISHLILKRGLDLTPYAALSRGVACVVGKTLIINLPGSTKAAQECLEAGAEVIPHAVDLITGRQSKVERVHASVGTKRSSVVRSDVVNRERVSPYNCISVTAAQTIIMDRINLLKKDKMVNWENAHDHVLAEDVSAKDYLPPCDVSLLDGYAVLSSDKAEVKEVLVASAAEDSCCGVKILPGYCARVNTGAAIPPGADAVVPVEKTTVNAVSEDKKEETKINVKTIPAKGFGIRVKGTDHAIGQLILATGTYVDSSGLGLLAAAGITSVRVFEKPLVAVLSTGNELLEPYQRLTPGKVRDSNRITLISLLKDEGFNSVDLGISVDDPDALRDALEKGFKTADVVVTTGSMSMGDRDYLKEILVHDFNAEICFGRVLMKPGKPTSFAVLLFEGKPKVWFGLPGNPASAFVTAHLFLLPGLRKISGRREVYPAVVKTTLQETIPWEDRPHYVRGLISYNEATNQWRTKLTGHQMSSRIGNCVNANCLVLIPVAPIYTSSTEQKQETTSNFAREGFSKPLGFGSAQTHNSSTFSSNISEPTFGAGSKPTFGLESQFGRASGSGSSPMIPNPPIPLSLEFRALLIGKIYFPENGRLAN